MAIMIIPRPVQSGEDDFGTIILKKAELCEAQTLYCQYAKTSEKDGVTTVDISGVPSLPQINNEFYISTKEVIESITGCSVELYEQKEGFWTYRIKPMHSLMQFDNV